MTGTTAAPAAMTAKHWSLLLATAAMLGSSFLFLHIAVDSVPPMTVAALRALIAAPLIWSFLWLSGGRLPPPGRSWWPLLVLGVLTAAIPWAAIAWGQQHIESGLGGILFGAIPVFAVVLGPLLLAEEGFSAGRLAGAGIGVAGVVLVVGPQALAGLDRQLAGALVTLGAAFSYTLGAIYARRRADVSPVVMATGQTIVGAVLLIPLALWLDRPWMADPSWSAAGATAMVAVLGTAVPMTLFFWLVRQIGASNASIMPLFMPVAAVALGAAVLGEALPWQAFAGLALILMGAVAVSRLAPAPALAGRTSPNPVSSNKETS